MLPFVDSLVRQITLTTLLDIAITAFFIYWLFSLIRGTRAVTLVIDSCPHEQNGDDRMPRTIIREERPVVSRTRSRSRIRGIPPVLGDDRDGVVLDFAAGR